MFRGLKKHLTPSTFIALLALVFAVTGGAFAASSHSGSSGAKLTASTSLATAAKAKPKPKAGARGPAGPKGATGATGAAGATGPAGAPGAKGENGAAGANGANGTNGEKGEKGEAGTPGTPGTPGTSGFTKMLPEGDTETGVFSFSTSKVGTTGSEEGEVTLENYVPISFSIPLEKALGASEVFFVTTEEQKEEGGKTPPKGCLGTAEAPTAAKGDLCVYQGGTKSNPLTIEVTVYGIIPPTAKDYNFPAGAGTSGALMAVIYKGPEEPKGGVIMNGSWAVTAP